MQSKDKSEVIKTLPMIPLRDMVVFPSTLVPFIIGRSSSIQALERASSQDKLIFLSAQMDASLDIPRPKDVFSMGIIAKIILRSNRKLSNIIYDLVSCFDQLHPRTAVLLDREHPEICRLQSVTIVEAVSHHDNHSIVVFEALYDLLFLSRL